MAITVNQIIERVKGRLDKIEPGKILPSETETWIHAVLLELFPKMLPFTQWFEEIVENVSLTGIGFILEDIGYIHSTKILTFKDGYHLDPGGFDNGLIAIANKNPPFNTVFDRIISQGETSLRVVGDNNLADDFVIPQGMGTAIIGAIGAIGASANLAQYDYYNLIKVVGPDGIIPKARNVDELDIVPKNKTLYENELRWWEASRKLLFAKGFGAEYPTYITLWFNRNPYRTTGDENVDMPDDWENQLLAGVMSIAAGKLEQKDEASRLRNEAMAILKGTVETSERNLAFEEKAKEEL